MSIDRSQSQSQITPLQAKMQYVSDHTNSYSHLSQPYGIHDPIIFQAALDNEAVQNILQADPNAIVTIVVPDDEEDSKSGNGNITDRKFKL